jgi:hypothetical protein
MTRQTPRWGCLTVLTVLLAGLAAPVAADDIYGSVRSSNGTPLAFATIEACRNGDRDDCLSSITDGRGRYTITGLDEGRYTVSVPGRRGSEQVDLSGSVRIDLTAD